MRANVLGDASVYRSDPSERHKLRYPRAHNPCPTYSSSKESPYRLIEHRGHASSHHQFPHILHLLYPCRNLPPTPRRHPPPNAPLPRTHPQHPRRQPHPSRSRDERMGPPSRQHSFNRPPPQNLLDRGRRAKNVRRSSRRRHPLTGCD